MRIGSKVRYKSISLGVLGNYHHGKVKWVDGSLYGVKWPHNTFVSTEHICNLKSQET